MKNIRLEWRHLAEGLLRVKALQAQFRAEWGPRLEKARREGQEVQRQRNRRLGGAAIIVALVLGILFFAAALALRFSLTEAFVLGLLFAGPAVAILIGLWVLFGAKDPVPAFPDLLDQWWGKISGRTSTVQRSGPALSARHYGDIGEESFVSYLTSRLSQEYVAVRGLLVVRNLDADVIVVGPTGIWVYEVKHWSGAINCERGEWSRVKTYRQPGGRFVREIEKLKPFDRQWTKEAGAVRENLRRRLPEFPELPNSVRGGLVFTHKNVSFGEDGSCQAWAGTPKIWVETLSNFPEVPGFTMEKRLRTLDALLDWSDQLHERQREALWATSSAVELAQRLYDDAVTAASSYFSDSSSPEGIATNEAAWQSRPRAIYYPHPDDPPQG